MNIETINPATGVVIRTYPAMTETAVKQIIDRTYAAFLKWRTIDLDTRCHYFLKLADNLLANKKKYATLMTTEMGKPISQSESEVEKCAAVCRYYAENASSYLQPRLIKTEMAKSYVAYQPLGVILAIMPWNFPFWQVFRAAVPTIVAGNGFLLKHAAISSGTSLAIEELFLSAGFPDDLFRSLLITSNKVDNVIMHPKVAATTLTGSTQVGQMVGAASAKLIKKSVLELGGNDPYVILHDADLELASLACVQSRMNNAGQSCIAAKRLIVVDTIKDAFIKLVHTKLARYRTGDPLDPHTQCGPLARHDLRETVHKQVQMSVKSGAKLLLGGDMPQGNGFYYPPTLVCDVKGGMPLYDEEVFGPVVTIISAKDEADAIHIANDTNYGLGSAVFSKDVLRAEKIAVDQIQAGTCIVNGFVASDPRVPFGGIKESGFGRELSLEGIHSFVNIKTIHVK